MVGIGDQWRHVETSWLTQSDHHALEPIFLPKQELFFTEKLHGFESCG